MLITPELNSVAGQISRAQTDPQAGRNNLNGLVEDQRRNQPTTNITGDRRAPPQVQNDSRSSLTTSEQSRQAEPANTQAGARESAANTGALDSAANNNQQTRDARRAQAEARQDQRRDRQGVPAQNRQAIQAFDEVEQFGQGGSNASGGFSLFA